MSDFKLGQPVIYRGKTYSFPGHVCAVTDDGQIVVRAIGTREGFYAGMKHIFGPSQLEPWFPHSFEGGERVLCDFPHCDCSMGAAERCTHPAAPTKTIGGEHG